MDFKSGLGALLQGSSGMQGLQNMAQQQGMGMGLNGLADLLKQRVMAEQMLREKLQQPMAQSPEQSMVPRVPTPQVPMPGNEPMGMGSAPGQGYFRPMASTNDSYRGSEPGSQEYFDERLKENAGKSGMDYDGYYAAKDWMERTEPTPEQRSRQDHINDLRNQLIDLESMPDGPEKQYRLQEIERQMDQLRGAQ